MNPVGVTNLETQIIKDQWFAFFFYKIAQTCHETQNDSNYCASWPQKLEMMLKSATTRKFLPNSEFRSSASIRSALADTSPFVFKRLQKRARLAGSERDLQAGRVSRQIEILKGRSN